LAAELTAERDKTKRYETREWLDGEIAKRGLAVPTKQRDRYLDIAIEKGRDVVGEILDARNAPPASNPLDGAPDPKGSPPATITQAADACMEEARDAIKARDAKAANVAHLVRAEA